MITIEYMHVASNRIYSAARVLTELEVSAFQAALEPETVLPVIYERDYEPTVAIADIEPNWEGLLSAVRDAPFQTLWLRLLETEAKNAYALMLTAFQERWRTEFNFALNAVLYGMPVSFTAEELAQIDVLLRDLNIR